MNEIWKDVPGYTGYYQVSNCGRVRSLDRIWFRVTGTHLRKGRTLKSGLNIHGYPFVVLCKCLEKKRIKTVHSLVATAFLGSRKSGYEVNHKNGVKTCNSHHNLEYVTHKENVRHGLNILGISRIKNSKLALEDALNIRKLIKSGISQRNISKQYGVHFSTISQINKNQIWKQ